MITIESRHLAIVHSILSTYVPDREVWAFGSRVGGIVKQYSDLDLAIIGDDPLPITILGALHDAFSESELPYKVDIVDWATTAASFRKIIATKKAIIQSPSGGKIYAP